MKKNKNAKTNNYIGLNHNSSEKYDADNENDGNYDDKNDIVKILKRPFRKS